MGIEDKNPYQAERFTDTIDYTYKYCNRLKLLENEFRARISDEFNEWLSILF